MRSECFKLAQIHDEIMYPNAGMVLIQILDAYY